MTENFATAEDFYRGKGNKATRLGPRVAVDTRGRQLDRYSKTPNQHALNKLSSRLTSLGVPEGTSLSYVNLMSRGDQLRFMNMDVTAEIALYLHNIGSDLQSNPFNYQAALPYINKLIPASAGETSEAQISRLRLAATFVRYINYMVLLTQQSQSEFREAIDIPG